MTSHIKPRSGVLSPEDPHDFDFVLTDAIIDGVRAANASAISFSDMLDSLKKHRLIRQKLQMAFQDLPISVGLSWPPNRVPMRRNVEKVLPRGTTQSIACHVRDWP